MFLKTGASDVSGLVMTDAYPTTLAFVHLFDNGDRDFTFIRKPGADIMYSSENIDVSAIEKAKVFHFGSLSLTDEPVRSATFAALDIAKKSGAVISYDPNYRAPLWDNPSAAKDMMLRGLGYADIVKISDNEIEFLFGDLPYEEAAKMLVEQGRQLVFITMGGDGAVYACRDGAGRAAGYPAKAVDATGAGDCFTAGVLYQYLKSGKDIAALECKDAAAFADFANAAASLCVRKKGGIPAMPALGEVEARQTSR